MKALTFEHLVSAVIVGNVCLVVAGLAFDEGRGEALLEVLHSGCLAFFVFELGLRLRRSGWRFFAGRWNGFEAALIVASILPALGADAGLLRLARLARLAHLGRHLLHVLPHLRLIRVFRINAAVVPKLAAATCGTGGDGDGFGGYGQGRR
jgi:voltage-gated sodium channel